MPAKINLGAQAGRGRLPRLVVACRRIVWLAGVPVLAIFWMLAVVVGIGLFLAIAAWIFLSGGEPEDTGNLSLLDQIENAPGVLWEKWGQLLSHND